jgi:alanyl-tRNA synthetase
LVVKPKDLLREKFSSDYERYYLVDLFKRRGFIRKKCENCGKHFWTLKENAKRCDDQPCSPYSFIGDPPTKKKLDFIDSWKTVENFFTKNGHSSIKRYPVVSRWRPDLFFTVASIIDFQRIEGGKVVFELPANPLIVPQMVVRFNDLPSVGVSGKHYTSYCMVGQHAIANKEGYWKDRCIDLDFELVTKEFGIPEDEVSFIEDVWIGYGAFGYSLEYFVRGLELGNAVFTAYEGDTTNYTEMEEKVVDMGAGLQRFCWIMHGTPTDYDSAFSYVLGKMKEVCKIEYDEDLFLRYAKLAGMMNLDDFPNLTEARKTMAARLNVDAARLSENLAPLEGLYAVADHAQTLLFGISDGLLPSNVGGGYNLRVLYRRAESFIRRFKFDLTIQDVANWHIDYLSRMYPELGEHRQDVALILDVESSRYAAAAQRVSRVISSLLSTKKELGTDDLIKLYDSDGITPEQLSAAGLKTTIPDDFYEKVLSRHSTAQKQEEKKGPKFDIAGLPETRLLFYEDDDLFQFEATVLRTYADGGYVVLDRTAFYPRGGGQEPDHGRLGGADVLDVEKYGGVVLHKIEGPLPKVGTVVRGEVDSNRRRKITRIHTATHIINGASREVLGNWIWQHSAFKEEDYGRLDITHFAHLTDEEVHKIERLANEIVMKNLPITTTFMPRKVAEERYGFKLYQGGVVPTRNLRIVNIGGWNVQACGGTHNRTTGEVGFIKITKTERIQDGVERLNFVAGESALIYAEQMYDTIGRISSLLATQRENVVKVVGSLKEELEEARRREKSLGLRVVDLSIPQLSSKSVEIKGAKLYLATDEELGEELIIAQGQSAVKAEPSIIYLSISPRGNSARIICFVGARAKELGVSADSVVRPLAKVLGGSGGGSAVFAQGGGPLRDKIPEVQKMAVDLVSSLVRG